MPTKKSENNFAFTFKSPVTTPEKEFLNASLDITFGMPTFPLTENLGNSGALLEVSSCAIEIKQQLISMYVKMYLTDKKRSL